MAILTKIVNWLYPYWCNFCPKRFRTETKFHAHYLVCEARKLAKKRMEEKYIADNAPVNRDQRRKMARKAGQIKDWGKLNAP